MSPCRLPPPHPAAATHDDATTLYGERQAEDRRRDERRRERPGQRRDGSSIPALFGDGPHAVLGQQARGRAHEPALELGLTRSDQVGQVVEVLVFEVNVSARSRNGMERSAASARQAS